MSASVTESQGVPAGTEPLWSRLPELDRLLQAAGLPTGADRWQNAQDLIAALAARHALPADPRALRPLLGPLFCRSPEEQRRFAELFDQWLGGAAPGEGQAAAIPTPGEDGRQPPPPPPPRWPILLALALVLAAAAVALYHWIPTEPVEAPPRPRPSDVLQPTPPPPFEGATDYLDLPLDPIPPRGPPEVLVPGPDARRWLPVGDWILPALPLVALIGAVAWGALRRRDVLRYRKGDADSPLSHITLAGEDDDLFDSPLLRAALRRLHTAVLVPTRRLDERETVEHTARGGGLFHPVYRLLPRVPDLVMLVDFHHRGDHLAGLAETLLRRLREAGLEVHRYWFQRDPARVRGECGRGLPLAALADRHSGARLLIVGDPAAFVDPWSEHPADWTEILALWPQRGLLTTRRPPDAWREALEGSGLATAPFGEAGMARLAGHLSRAPISVQASVDPLLPGRLAGRALAADGAPDPAERRAVLAELDAWLGPRGGLLLGAAAVYPELHPGLTRRLDRALFPADPPDTRAQRLLRLARLPWLRAGHLPDWLRLALHERRGTADTRRIGSIYRELLRQATVDGEGAERLTVAGPRRPESAPRRLLRRIRERDWRLDRWIRDLARLSGPDAPLKDRIFLDTVLRPRLLDFQLPPWLARLLPRRRWRPAGALGLAALAVLGGGALHLAWQGSAWTSLPAFGGLRPRAAEAMVAAEQRRHRNHPVQIIHVPATAALAERLAGVLAQTGFPQPALSALPVAAPPSTQATQIAAQHQQQQEQKPQQQQQQQQQQLTPAEPNPPPRPVNTVQVGAEAALGAAAFIAERLGYLAWGDPPVTANRLAEPPPGADPALAGDPPPGRLIRVWLTTTGHGGIFTDGLRRPLGDTEHAAFRNPDGLGLPEPTLPGPRILRDRLRDGTQGPAMVALPGGTFWMGSPEDEPERSSDEGPRHQVTLRPFAVGRTEVSFAEYDRFAKATGREKPNDNGWGRGERPVINVSWQDASAYAQWLAEETGQPYRLPSEAEWEYAARAGTETPFWTGGCIHTDQANYDGTFDYNGCGANTGVNRQQTLPAGSLPPNLWGLHEAAGNVWEWVADCWHDTYEGAPADGSAWGEAGGGDCARRVVRGGGWGSGPSWLRSAGRGRGPANVADFIQGFRLARTL